MFTLVLNTDDAIVSNGEYVWNINWNVILDLSLPPNTIYEIQHKFLSQTYAIDTATSLNNEEEINLNYGCKIITCNLQTNGYSPPLGDSQSRTTTNNQQPNFNYSLYNPINIAYSKASYVSDTEMLNMYIAEENTFMSRNVNNMAPIRIKHYSKYETTFNTINLDGVHMFTLSPILN